MINSIEELMLTEYFFICAIVGRFIDNGKALFGMLARMFFISASNEKKMYAITESEDVKVVESVADYMMYRRVQKYIRLNGGKTNYSECDEMIRIKGNALLAAKEKNILSDRSASRNSVYTLLSVAANNGMVSALRTIGILQYTGIFFDKDKVAAEKELQKAAMWNDVISILALLFFDEKDRAMNMARLYAVLSATPYMALYARAKSKYKIFSGTELTECRLLSKAFSSGTLKPEQYDPKYARILYSSGLGTAGKKKLIFSENRELVSAIANLPLKLCRKSEEASFSVKTVLERKSEQGRISVALDCRTASDKAGGALCLTCSDDYMLELYAEAIQNGAKSFHVVLIEAASLNEYDLEPTVNNIFIRNADEKKNNIYLIFMKGDLPSAVRNAISEFVQYEKRSNFYICGANLTINLGNIMPVCLCDDENLKFVKPLCNVIEVTPPSLKEKRVLINYMALHKSNEMQVSINLSSDAEEFLEKFGCNEAERMIDAIVRAEKYESAAIAVTKDKLKLIDGDVESLRHIGFGGKNRI